jgi:hypothetical protein
VSRRCVLVRPAVGGDADRDDDDLAGVLLARRDPQPGLGRMERRRRDRPHRRPGGLARRGVHAAGHVARDDRDPALGRRGHRLDGVERVAARRAARAGAEHRVDDPRRLHQRAGVERPRRRARQPLAVRARVAAQLARAAAEQLHVHLAPLLAQHARRDEAVAAVVAVPADDGDHALGNPPRDQLREPAARRLHQLQPGDAALLDRPRVERALGGRVGQRLQPGGKPRHPGEATRR